MCMKLCLQTMLNFLVEDFIFICLKKRLLYMTFSSLRGQDPETFGLCCHLQENLDTLTVLWQDAVSLLMNLTPTAWTVVPCLCLYSSQCLPYVCHVQPLPQPYLEKIFQLCENLWANLQLLLLTLNEVAVSMLQCFPSKMVV